MLRRRMKTSGSELFPELVNVLLHGWGGPHAADDPDPFRVFDYSDEALADVWRRHRRALMAEATRRGIAQPWGTQFDSETIQ